MSEPTRSPWEAHDCRVFNRTPDGHIGILVCSTANNARTRTLEAEANARLIAAAPDLLAACQTLVKYATTRDGRPADHESVVMTFVEDGSTLTECLDAARAALATAEGR